MATVKKVKKYQSGGMMDTKLKDVPEKVLRAKDKMVDRVKNSTVGDAVDFVAPGARKAISAGSKAYKSFKDQVGSMNKGLPKKKSGGGIKKAQDGTPIVDRLAAKTAERNTKGPALREGQKSRLDRINASNPDRAIKVGKRMLNRATPAMKKGGKVTKKK